MTMPADDSDRDAALYAGNGEDEREHDEEDPLVSCDGCACWVPRDEARRVRYGPWNTVGEGTFCRACRGVEDE